MAVNDDDKTIPKGWKRVKLGEVGEIFTGKLNSNAALLNGEYPFFTCAPVPSKINYYDYDLDAILLAGNNANGIFHIHRYCGKFNAYQRTYIITSQDTKTSLDYLFYSLKLKLNYMKEISCGSATKFLTMGILSNLEILLPPLEEQKAIASVLSSLDDKIDLLHRQNQTLEAMAETLFRKWFIEDAKEEWEREPLGKHVVIKRGGSPRPIHDYISNTGLNWLKISDVTGVDSPFIFEIKEKIKEEGLSKTTLLKKGSLVLSNSATPGIPKILDVDSCIHDGWLHFPQSKFSKEFLYLLFKHIRPKLIQIGNGSIFTNLKTDILKEYIIAIPDDDTLSKFDKQVKRIFEKLYSNTQQIHTLTQLRDTLLPKLMSGKVKVEL